MSSNRQLIAFYVLIAAVVGGLFFTFTQMQGQPSGVDGFYYLKQFKYFGQTFGFYFQDRSLAYVIPFFLQLFLKNELLVFRIACSLTFSLLLLSQVLLAHFFLRKKITPSLSLGLLALGFCLFNVSTFDISLSFYKNAFGLMTFSFGFLFFNLFKEKDIRYFLWLALAFLAVSLFSHKSSLLWIGCLLLAQCSQNEIRLTGKKLLLSTLGVFVVFVIFLIFFEHAAAFLLAAIGSLNWNEDYWAWLLHMNEVGEYIIVPYCLQLLIFVVFMFQYEKRDSDSVRFNRVFYILVFMITLLPIYPSHGGELGYRLLISTTCLLGPALALLFAENRWKFSWAEAGLALLLMQFTLTPTLTRQFVDREPLRAGVLRLPDIVKPGDYLITHHGLEFYIDYLTDIRARIFLPDTAVAGTVYHLIYVPFGSLDWIKPKHFIYNKALLKIGSNYFLLKEADWQEIKERLKPPSIFQNEATFNPGHVHQ